MKIEVTVDREDVTKAIEEWFKRSPEYQLVKTNTIIVGWTGGTIILRPEGDEKEPAF